MFICVSHQLGLLENLKNYAGKFQRKHNYVFKHPTPMNLLQQIYSQLHIQSKRLECCDCTSFWFHLSYDFNIFDYKSTWMYKVNMQVLVLTDFKIASSWCLMGTSSYSAAFEIISKRPLIFVLLFRDRLKVSVRKKQPLELISSSPCSKETNRIFCSHNYSLNSYYCRFWSWIIPLY